MLKNALQFITDLKERSMNIQTIEHNGHMYHTGNLYQFNEDEIKSIQLSSIKSLCDYVLELIQNSPEPKPFVIKVSYDNVKVYSGLDYHKQRSVLASATPLLPRIDFNTYLDMEQFVIMLKTTFVETDNLNNLVSIVSRITDHSKVEFEDDGFGMKVTTSTGVHVQSNSMMSINPIVNLQPIRTFYDVEQPASRFLIRVKDGGRIALMEADGGAWKLDAQRIVADYLHRSLQCLVDDGFVVILG